MITLRAVSKHDLNISNDGLEIHMCLETIANTMMAKDGENSRAKRWVAIMFLQESDALLGCFVFAE